MSSDSGRAAGRRLSQFFAATTELSTPSTLGLHRPRVLEPLTATLPAVGLAVILAPAGWGKTTLARQLLQARRRAGAAGDLMLRLRADHARASAFTRALLEGAGAPEPPDRTGSVDPAEAARALLGDDESNGRLVVLDDAHQIQHTEAERWLERMLDLAPDGVGVVLLSRSPPGMNLSRRRVCGEVLEIGAEELRFRTWEVERLFTDTFRHPLPPHEVAELTSRTGGWAAGLQLFHLSTEGRGPKERQRVLEGLGSRSRMVREYLTRNVLDELPASLREFLLRTCVFREPRAALCDELLGSAGAAALLEELERRQLFVCKLDGDDRYHYHELLRSHLEATLVAELGEEAVRLEHRRAGHILEAHGLLAEAVGSFARAEAWDDLARVLARGGTDLAWNAPALRGLPPSLPLELRRNDGWLLLGEARRLVASGDLTGAVAIYRDAESAFGHAAPADEARRERLASATWLPSAAPPARPAHLPPEESEWAVIARRALVRDPAGEAERALRCGTPAARLVAATGYLLANRTAAAAEILDALVDGPDSPPTVRLAAQLVATVSTLLTGQRVDHRAVTRLLDDADDEGMTWLGWVASALSPVTDPSGPTERADAPGIDADGWGRPLRSLLGALAGADQMAAPTLFEAAAIGFGERHATVLECWARAGEARALEAVGRDPGPALELVQRLSRRAAMPPPALARPPAMSQPDSSAEERTGVSLLPAPAGSGARANEVVLRCLGRFELSTDGVPLDMGVLKPRVRSLLQLLASHEGNELHREVILGELWPESTEEAALRSLHVAVSALRRLGQGGSAGLVERKGPAYRLRVDQLADFDLGRFAEALRRARQTPLGTAERSRLLAAALAAYGGPLIPEAGPAEWIVPARLRLQRQAAGAAVELAEYELGADDPRAAAATADRGLEIDPYEDRLWQLALRARRASGEAIAAAALERRYRETLAQLGLTGEAGAATGLTGG